MSYLELRIEKLSGKLYVVLPSRRKVFVSLSDIIPIGSPRHLEAPSEFLEARLGLLTPPVYTIDDKTLSANVYFPLVKGIGLGNRGNIIQLYHVREEVLRRYNKT